MSTIMLKSSDEVTFEVDLTVASHLGIIKRMLDEQPVTEEGEEFQLPTVKSDTLSKIITWAVYHSMNDPIAGDNGHPPLETGTGEEVEISGWDEDFLKMDMKDLYELNVAADNLDIKGLTEITVKTAANMIKGKTVKKIRSMFSIKNDFTEKEEKQIRVENKWREGLED